MKRKTFNEMTRPERRVAIAKDVLQQLKLKKYKASRGTYVQTEFKNDNFWEVYHKNAKENFGELKKCKVCAIGSCIVSATRLGNTLTFHQMSTERNPETKKLLKKAFTQKQLYLMETAFEMTTVSLYNVDKDPYIPNKKTENEAVKARSFGHKYNNDTERITAIMKNIVKNRGEFKP